MLYRHMFRMCWPVLAVVVLFVVKLQAAVAVPAVSPGKELPHPPIIHYDNVRLAISGDHRMMNIENLFRQ